jgi:hypothetical protein
MDPRTFAVERLGIGDWPATDGLDAQVIDSETWAGLADMDSVLQDPVTLAFDVTPDRSTTSIAAAGVNAEGLGHVEIVERKRGTGWVVEYLQERVEKHEVSAVVCDGTGPAASLLAPLEQLDIEVTVVNAKEHAQACGTFYDGCQDESFRHLDTPELSAASRGRLSVRSVMPGPGLARSRPLTSPRSSPPPLLTGDLVRATSARSMTTAIWWFCEARSRGRCG